MKRIIKVTRQNGEVEYVVEKKTWIFGWTTDTIHVDDIACDAVFGTLEEAQRFIGIDTNPIIKREVVHG